MLTEYRRRKQAYDAASNEVVNSQRSLKVKMRNILPYERFNYGILTNFQKMVQMAKQRKEFIASFRESIMLRTHYVFQALLRTRNFEVSFFFYT